MRAFLSIGLLAGLIAITPQPAPAAEPPPANQGEIQTPDRAGTANLSQAAQAPLHDLNIRFGESA